eukprot:2113730-Lingulodinium_polyedra.AAC.1
MLSLGLLCRPGRCFQNLLGSAPPLAAVWVRGTGGLGLNNWTCKDFNWGLAAAIAAWPRAVAARG